MYSIVVGMVICSPIICLIVIYRCELVSVYTSEPMIAALAISVIPLMAIDLFTNMFKGILNGIVRGLG